ALIRLLLRSFLLGIAMAIFSLSIGLRLHGRAGYFGGHELEHAAEGLYMVSTQSPWKVLHDGLFAWRPGEWQGPYSPGTFVAKGLSAPDGLLFSTLPGLLAAICPSRFWGVVVNIAAFVVSLAYVWAIYR